MKKKHAPESDGFSRDKHSFEPEPSLLQPLVKIDPGFVCKECLNEDFDSCVCPEPEKQPLTPVAPDTKKP